MKRALKVSLVVLAIASPNVGRSQIPDAKFRDPGDALLGSVSGVGGRALGMGGAFIAIADDATAASWNPAGLAKLTRPEASIVGESASGDYQDGGFLYREIYAETEGGSEVFSYDYRETLTSEDASADSSGLSFVSATYPFKLGKRLLVAQVSNRKYFERPDFDSSGQYAQVLDFSIEGNRGQITDSFGKRVAVSAGGGSDLYTLSLATAITEKFRVGLSVNYVDGSESSAARTTFNYSDGTDEVLVTSSRSEYTGLYFDLGIQADVTDWLAVGAVYHSGFSDSLKIRENTDCCRFETEGDFDWPDGWAVGLAVRPTDRWTFSADYSVTNWSGASQSVRIDRFLGPVTGSFGFPTGGSQEDAAAIRFGVEYVVSVGSGVLPLRAGYFVEEQPSSFYPAPEGTSFEQPETDGFTLGLGYSFAVGKSMLQFDVAYIKSTTDESLRRSFDEGSTDGSFGYRYQITFSAKPELDRDRIVGSFIVRF